MAPLESIVARLERTSAYMHWACSGLTDTELREQPDGEFSPIGWHLGHVAWQEELWAMRALPGRPALCEGFDEVFDSFRPGKARRGKLLPTLSVLLEYRAEVRARLLARLDELLQADRAGLMNGEGLLHFVANHESQHIETVLALRLAAGLSFGSARHASRPDACGGATTSDDSFVFAGGGTFRMGSDDDPDRWDNECPSLVLNVPPFLVQAAPVSNALWLRFMADNGYRERGFWSEAGWQFIKRGHIESPLYWFRDAAGAWHERTLGGPEPLNAGRPVCHVSWHEARAFARYAGARLGSEREWEWLTQSTPERCELWDDFEVSQLDLSLGRLVRSPGGGPKVGGLSGLRGSVWEWTEQVFHPYPGFVPQAYAGYSQPWFDGKHRVLRGGSYVTEPGIARKSFRNWYLPEMRRPFLGLRLFKDLP